MTSSVCIVHKKAFIGEGFDVFSLALSFLDVEGFADDTNRTSQANIDSYKTNSNAKKVHVMKQGAAKKNMLECMIIG